MDEGISDRDVGDEALGENRADQASEVVLAYPSRRSRQQDVERGTAIGGDGPQRSRACQVCVGLGGEGDERGRGRRVVHAGTKAGEETDGHLERVGVGFGVADVWAHEHEVDEQCLDGRPMAVQGLAGHLGSIGEQRVGQSQRSNLDQ